MNLPSISSVTEEKNRSRKAWVCETGGDTDLESSLVDASLLLLLSLEPKQLSCSFSSSLTPHSMSGKEIDSTMGLQTLARALMSKAFDAVMLSSLSSSSPSCIRLFFSSSIPVAWRFRLDSLCGREAIFSTANVAGQTTGSISSRIILLFRVSFCLVRVAWGGRRCAGWQCSIVMAKVVAWTGVAAPCELLRELVAFVANCLMVLV